MRRFLSVALPVAVVIVLAGVVFAQGPGGWGGGPMAGGMGGMMGPGVMGGGMGPGGQADQRNCPGMTTGGRQAPATPSTEEKAGGPAQ